MDLIKGPVRIATSKPAQQTYLNTLLFMITSLVLLGLAAFAYVLFYLNYVPQMGIERVVHLQYGDGPHPYGTAFLDSSLVSQQPYDISLTLHVPRSPPNLSRGNFMLSLSLLPPLSTTSTSPLTPSSLSLSKTQPLFTTRRPALLPYESRLISLSSRLLSLPLYILSLRSESSTLHIPMAEGLSFPKGGRTSVPSTALLEVQAGQDVQIYSCTLHFTAKFTGLRWLMYNHRILSFLLFTGSFWISEVLFTAIGWLALRSFFASPESSSSAVIKTNREEGEGGAEDSSPVKKEPATDDEPDLSDTPRTFPTYGPLGRQRPLFFEPPLKNEDDSEEYGLDQTAVQPLGGGGVEADDEDEFEGVARERDSGIGTSYSDAGAGGVGAKGLARRRSRGGRGG